MDANLGYGTVGYAFPMTTGERRSDATPPAQNGRSTSAAHSGHQAAHDGHEQPVRGGLAVEDPAFRETVDAVAESGGTELAAEQIPTEIGRAHV